MSIMIEINYIAGIFYTQEGKDLAVYFLCDDVDPNEKTYIQCQQAAEQGNKLLKTIPVNDKTKNLHCRIFEVGKRGYDLR